MKPFFAATLVLLMTSISIAQISSKPLKPAPPGPPAGPPAVPGDVIKFDKLRAIDEQVDVYAIQSAKPVAGAKQATVRILMSVKTACGKEFYVDYTRPEQIAFYQLGYAGVPHVQPACFRTLEHLWAPMDWNLKPGDAATQSITISADSYSSRTFIVSAQLANHSTQTSTMFEVSDVKVSEQ